MSDHTNTPYDTQHPVLLSSDIVALRQIDSYVMGHFGKKEAIYLNLLTQHYSLRTLSKILRQEGLNLSAANIFEKIKRYLRGGK